MIEKIKLFIIISVSFISISYGQDTSSYQYLDSLVNDYVKRMQANNIDTICVYKEYCVGCVYIFDDENDVCNYSSVYVPTYIFWKKQGITYLTKKDNCFDYATIPMDSLNLWKLFLKYRRQIKKEKTKIFEYIAYKNSKKEKYFIMIDHSNHKSFEIMIDGEIFMLNIDEFDMTKEYDGLKNINYQHNNKLKGKIIIDELNAIVNQIEKQELLTKFRR
ncbi:MAG: hypothetical protein LBR64_09805 [Dysgonamonadaceae bacterium]|jgi:hypothetical protein|nr:hypothetical protein [Dysgonamonadaceae bacterium]